MSALSALLLFVGGVTIRPYIAPKLDPEPELTPAAVSVVEIVPSNDAADTIVLARPTYASPLAGHVQRGARIPIRGELAIPKAHGCATGLYYALDPLGFICSTETRPTAKPATTESVVELVPDSPLPFRYAMVLVEEGSTVPMWASVADLHDHAEPERQLGRGDTIALRPELEVVDGVKYYVTIDGKVVPVQGSHLIENYSQWQGVVLDDSTHLPFGWVTPDKATVYDAPGGSKVDQVLRRERLDILEDQTIGKTRWVRVGEARWLKAGSLNEVRKIDRPSGTGEHAQWFDVDLGEQVVVAYRNAKPVYATLTSSGREPNHTPRGNYPIWGKVSSITMKSQDYDDVQYYVNHVPWVMFFQAHNALHGAYWHDRFGSTKSHGCANLAPRDAKYLFDWLEPALPPGWTSIRNWDLTTAPVAHVHDSHKDRDIFQERNIGPPDKNDEADRLEKAITRRESKEREEAAAAAASGIMPPTAAPSVAVQTAQPVPIAPVPGH
jgi:hypothetical protein